MARLSRLIAMAAVVGMASVAAVFVVLQCVFPAQVLRVENRSSVTVRVEVDTVAGEWIPPGRARTLTVGRLDSPSIVYIHEPRYQECVWSELGGTLVITQDGADCEDWRHTPEG